MQKLNLRKAASMAAIIILSSLNICPAQNAVNVGRGSYAEYPPTYKGRTSEHDWTTGCDQSTFMQNKQLWVTEDPTNPRPIPTNDWWTGLLNAEFADALWSYPQMVHPDANGITINYPTYWNENGTEVKSKSSISVGGTKFTAESAIAHNWHDWDVEMLQRSSDASQEMLTTLTHGSPFTWVEMKGITPKLTFSDLPEFFNAQGTTLNEKNINNYTSNYIGVRIDDDFYGIYLPQSCVLSYSSKSLIINPPTADTFVVIALLPSSSSLADYSQYAYSVPRNTTVGWEYNEKKGQLTTSWQVDAINLLTGSSDTPVMQGFLPHAYKNNSLSFSFSTDSFLTPRGTLKMATTQSGSPLYITYSFNGMLPFYAVPQADSSLPNPYRPEVMTELISNYALNGSFGADTYWGGKGLTQMALNMTFAHQTGDTENFILCRDRLKEVMIDWLTFTPGEKEFCFTFYPRWGGLVGYNTTYDSDTFNDHHFHYGYFTYAGALLCMFDPEFKAGYGDMLRLIAKDYANWDRSDTRFPFLRTLDPWVGHSYAGGLGDQGNSNGNGQESSSESMQGWGGVYLLGVALDDKEMRDAGLFGWITEARATREYWFDVDSRFPKNNQTGNYDYSLYTNPYNTNITCKGIGWWTWFGGDPLFMHGIQWMPISPALDYLSWDRDFVEWAYNDMMTGRSDYSHKWFEDTTDPEGNKNEMLAANDWGNVTLAYMQRALPDQAAQIFDQAWDKGLHIAKSTSTSHISYYVIHSHRTYGEIDTDVHADIPTAVAYTKDSDTYTYMVYNPSSQRQVTFYKDGSPIKSVTAPAQCLTVFDAPSVPTSLNIESAEGTILPAGASSQLTATLLDQYGASIDDTEITWNVPTELAQISDTGLLTIAQTASNGSTLDIQASTTKGGVTLTASLSLTVNPKPYPAQGSITPAIKYIEKGSPCSFSLSATDQYGNPFVQDTEWSISLNGEKISDTPQIDANTVGLYTITATTADKTFTHTFFVTPPMQNLALGKTAYESSHENEGSLKEYACDGDPSTRWGSAHSDNQWIYIDLGKKADITRTCILWEAAYAASYQIQVSDNATDWTTVKTVTGLTDSSRLADVQSVNASGRYIRMFGLSRATTYGFSLYEFQVFGIYSDTADDDIIGIDITSSQTSIREDATATLTAKAYTLAGTPVDTDVTWSATNGSITADGIFTPLSYGEAVITVSTPSASASLSIYVEEIIKLAMLSASPQSAEVILGDTYSFKISGTDQFGGVYPLTSTDITAVVLDTDGSTASSAPSQFASFDVNTSTFSATNVGSYIIRLTSANTSLDIPVTVKNLTEINLALNKPVTASSQTISPEGINDGDLTTRWQSAAADSEYITIDLQDSYLLSRMILTWEAAYASAYHFQTSLDGEHWTTIAHATCSAANTPIETTLPDIPARYVRLICDSRIMSDYGASPYEWEIYGSARFEAEDDLTPPVINTTSLSDSQAILNASDASGYIFYDITLRDNAVISPSQVSLSTYARTNEDATITLSSLNPATTYNVTISAADPFGNTTVSHTTITTADTPIQGINLALNKPVSATSYENAGTMPQFANDGDLTTRWGSLFNDGEAITIDLQALYALTQIILHWDTGARAANFTLEASSDGETFTVITTQDTDGGQDIISAEGINARYVRLTGNTRINQYGTSIFEIEVYGSDKMLCVIDSQGSALKLAGKWDDTLFARIDSPTVTAYDMAAVKDAPAEIPAANPNCIIFTPITSVATRAAAANIAIVSGGTATASNITLTPLYSFSTPVDVQVSGSITYTHPQVAESVALMLPFSITPSEDTQYYIFSHIEADKIRFYKGQNPSEPNTPYIFRFSTPKSEITVHGGTLFETPADFGFNTLRATYIPFTSNGEMTYADSQFSVTSQGTGINAFQAYISDVPAIDTLPVSFDLTTTVSNFADPATLVNVYSIDGRIIRLNVPIETALKGLTPGIWIVGNRKVVITH